MKRRKPSNVLLAEDGPRVIDFGISGAVESTALTQAGLVIGSPGFMSPEQAAGFEVGPPSDIFSLGAVLAFAATGEGPFGTGTTAALLYRVVHGSPGLDRIPSEVRPLIERCLAKDPSQRPTAAGLLAEVGTLQPTANWLPESIIRAFAGDTSPGPGASAAAGFGKGAGVGAVLESGEAATETRVPGRSGAMDSRSRSSRTGRRAMTCLESMTSDTAKPEAKSETKSETFRSHLPAIVAATTGTVLAATLGSLIGTAGTIAGMVIGSMASGTCSWRAERGIRRSTALASARVEAIRARGRQLHPGEDATATQDTAVTQDTGAVPAAGRAQPVAAAPALGWPGRGHRRRVHRLRHCGHPGGGGLGQATVGHGPGQAGPRHHPRRRSRRQGRPGQAVPHAVDQHIGQQCAELHGPVRHTDRHGGRLAASPASLRRVSRPRSGPPRALLRYFGNFARTGQHRMTP